ncbi:MAG: hypothetical protein K1X29_00410 [Bdellovibrionales bacterium]|nr:hypothetical protein [Bdellovibrionales bacterium]
MKKTELFFIFIFVCIISTPLVAMLFGHKNELITENRLLAEAPPIKSIFKSKYLLRLDKYLEDNFSFRTELLKFKELLTVQIDGYSNENVLEGREGWLFYRGENNLLDYQNDRPFTSEEVKLWVKYIELQIMNAKKIGAQFLFMVTPNAHTIYGDSYLPKWIKKRGKISRLDQLASALQEAEIGIIDPRKRLLAEKKDHKLYHQTDTHWTEMGAYFGYIELMKGLRLIPIPLSHFFIAEMEAGHLDLTVMLGPLPIKEKFQKLIPNFQRRAKTFTVLRGGFYEDVISKCESCDDLRAVVFRDSFMKDMIPFLSEHFRRVYYRWTYQIDWDLIKNENPKVIVQQLVERALFNLPPPIVN